MPQCGDSWTTKQTACNTQNSLWLLLLASLNINGLPYCSHIVGQSISDHPVRVLELWPLLNVLSAPNAQQNCQRPVKLKPQPSLKTATLLNYGQNAFWTAAGPVHNKPKVKTGQTLRNFHGSLSSRGIVDGLVLEAKLYLFIFVTYCSYTALWPISALSSRAVSQITLGKPEAGLAKGICCRHPSLRKRSVSVLFSKEPKQSLWCIHTLSDAFIPSRATEVAVLCLQMLPEHKTNSVRWDATHHAHHNFFSESWNQTRATGFNFCMRFISHMHSLFHGWWPILFCCLEITLSYNHWVFVHKGCPEAGLPNITIPAHQRTQGPLLECTEKQIIPSTRDRSHLTAPRRRQKLKSSKDMSPRTDSH